MKRTAALALILLCLTWARAVPAALIQRISSNVVRIATYDTVTPQTFSWHTLELIPPTDGQGNPVEIPQDDVVTLVLDGHQQQIVCDGSEQALQPAPYPELSPRVRCTVDRSQPGPVTSITVDVVIYHPPAYDSPFDSAPASTLDPSLAGTTCAAWTETGSCTFSGRECWTQHCYVVAPYWQLWGCTFCEISGCCEGITEQCPGNHAPAGAEMCGSAGCDDPEWGCSPGAVTCYSYEVCADDQWWRCSLDGQEYEQRDECVHHCRTEHDCSQPESPACVTDATIADAEACKWQIHNQGSDLLAGRGVPADWWVVYSRTTVESLELGYDIDMPPAIQDQVWCAVDLNGDGDVSEEEFALCVETDAGPMCPLRMVECTATYSDPICPEGGSLNPSTDLCEAPAEVSCPDGFSYDETLDRCVADPSCPAGGYLDPAQDRCEIQPSDDWCPEGYWWDPGLGACVSSPQCPEGGHYDAQRDACVHEIVHSCPDGFEYDQSEGVCWAQPSCPDGFTYDPTHDLCVSDPVWSCPAGMTYNPSRHVCEALPDCPGTGSYDSALDACTQFPGYECPSGYEPDAGRPDLCVRDPTCPDGFSFDGAHDVCLKQVAWECPSGYTYNPQTAKCERAPLCPTGSTYNPSTDRCELGPVCPPGGSYDPSTEQCRADADWQCSANGQTYEEENECESSCTQAGTCTEQQSCTTEHCAVFIQPCQGLYPSGCCAESPCWPPQSGHYPGCPLCPNNQVPPGGTVCGEVWSPVCSDGSWGPSWQCVSYESCTSTWKCSLNDQSYPSQAECEAQCQQSGTCTIVCPPGYTPSGATCAAPASCPQGFTYVGGLCIANPSCPDGGALNPSTDVCELDPDPDCPAGSSYDPALGMCVSDPTCPAPGSYSSSADRCEVTVSPDCAAGYSFDPESGLCEAEAICPASSDLNTSTDLCEAAPQPQCPAGSGWSSGIGKCAAAPNCAQGSLDQDQDRCEVTPTEECLPGYSMNGDLCTAQASCPAGTLDVEHDLCVVPGSSLCPDPYAWNGELCTTEPSCPSPSEYSTEIDTCVAGAEHQCPDQYSYNPTTRLCEAYPICQSGSYDPVADGCYEGDTTCPYGPEYPCVPYEGRNVCSPDPCHEGAGDIEDVDPGGEGENDPKNDGQWTDEGECLGTIYIFSGRDMRCRVPGIETGWFNCCDGGDTWFGMARCNETEQMIAELKRRGMCHKVGTYCSKKILDICVQRKKTYCCFNSKLARIVHEQGRPQLEAFAGNLWGEAESPRCRGFTVEEFQMLDFNRIDLSEWYGDIVTATQNEIGETILHKTQQFLESLTE